jgi:hypothetical protein
MREREMIRYLTCVLAALAALIISYPGQAADGAKAYAPDLGDFMGLTQLRHFKLWYAGRSKNWELADYEIEQIRKSFESVKVFYPTLGDVDMAKMIKLRSAERSQEGGGRAGREGVWRPIRQADGRL